jgi:hypothetical protein
METEDFRTGAYGILATLVAFHQALREIERLPQKSSPTYLRIRKTLLSRDRFVDRMTESDPSNSTIGSTTRGGELTGAGGVVAVCVITPDGNGIHGGPEITAFPISDREITLRFRFVAN